MFSGVNLSPGLSMSQASRRRTPAYLARWLPEETSEFTGSPSTQAWFQQEQNQGQPALSLGPCLSCGSRLPALASQHRVQGLEVD